MKRNIVEKREDRTSRISCPKCGDTVGVMPAGSLPCSRSQSTSSIEISCKCGYKQSVYIASAAQVGGHAG